MASSSWEVKKGDAEMDSNTVPAALRERLGAEGTVGLVQLLDVARSEWTADVVNLSLERFERRLVEEVSGLRVEMARGHATLREELAHQGAALRVEIAALRTELKGEIAGLRTELKGEIAGLRTELKGEMHQEFGALRGEMATNRFELLKWCFLFWVGQVLVTMGIVGALLRVLGPVR